MTTHKTGKGRKKKKVKYYQEKILAETYNWELKGLSHRQLSVQRGLRGIKLGPVGPGRKLSEPERKAIEQKLREEGKL
jgi:hypothetical protein